MRRKISFRYLVSEERRNKTIKQLKLAMTKYNWMKEGREWQENFWIRRWKLHLSSQNEEPNKGLNFFFIVWLNFYIYLYRTKKQTIDWDFFYCLIKFIIFLITFKRWMWKWNIWFKFEKKNCHIKKKLICKVKKIIF